MSVHHDRQLSGRKLLGALHAHLQRQKDLGLNDIPASVALRWAEQLREIEAQLASGPEPDRAAASGAAAVEARQASPDSARPASAPGPSPTAEPPRAPATAPTAATSTASAASQAPAKELVRTAALETPGAPSRSAAVAASTEAEPARVAPPAEPGKRRRVERADVPWANARGGAQPAAPRSNAAGAAAPLTMDSVRDLLGECERCGRCTTRTRILFGAGDQKANLVFVLDPPDAQDDHVGHLLTGDAGDLFDSMLQKGMGLAREQIYATPVVKCFSGSTKAPARDELAACAPFLQDQLRVVSPTAIVALGASAAAGLLGPRFDLRTAHGQWAQWKGVPVMPTYSLASMIAQPALKRDVWTALKQVMGRLDIPRPDDTTS